VSVVAVVLLVAAVVLLAAAELPRLAGGRGRAMSLPKRRTKRRSPHLRIVKDDESDEFARSVERDLANLPTYDPRAKRD
jgi:Sec-independent protein translocase protein TatA